MTAPTEAEIRAAVDAVIRRPRGDRGRLSGMMASPLHFVEQGLRGPAYDPAEHLWDDLTLAQAARLSELHDDVIAVADAWQAELEAKIAEAVVQAALTFAREYPDAPRAQQEGVIA